MRLHDLNIKDISKILSDQAGFMSGTNVSFNFYQSFMKLNNVF